MPRPAPGASLLQHLFSTGFADIHGTLVSVVLPIREALLNEFAQEPLTAAKGRVQQLELRIRENNRVQIGAKVRVGPFSNWFRPELIVATRVEGGSPRILLTVASPHYSALFWVIEAFAREVLPAGIGIGNGRIEIDLARVEQLVLYRPLLTLIKSLDVGSADGLFLIGVELRA